MDSELFTIGGAEQATATIGEVYFRTIRSMKVWRWVGQVLVVYLVLLCIVTLTQIFKAYTDYNKKSDFTQKEGLQYLGASTNVVRDDTGWGNKLTPDEAKMLAQQTAVTDMESVTKATFLVPRERMAPTPEEELLKKQAQAQS